MLLEEVEFVVLDTETTGLDPKSDRVLSVGAVKVRGLQVHVAESFACLVQQQVAAGNKSAEVHGILPAQVQQGLTEEQALEAFLDFAGAAVLVGNHVAFDIAMLNQMVRHCGISGRLSNRSLDTARLARRLERLHHSPDSFRPADYSLDALCARYHLPTDARHTAPGDAFTTAILLLKLLARARKRGIMRLKELLK